MIITDIQMPGKNGLELMKLIRNHNPDVKAIYISADLGQYWPILEKEKARYPVSCLQKPFSKIQLIRLLSDSSN